MFIKVNSGVIFTKDTPIKDENEFVENLIDELTDVIERYGCEWCVGFSYGQDIQKEYEEDTTSKSTATWLPTNDDNKKRCSNCDIIHLIAQYPSGDINWCPNCGAKMKWEESNGGDTKHS